MSFPDPPDSFATRGFGVTGGSTSLSLVLTLWGRISKARDMLGQREGGNQRSLISQILPPRCFQPFGAEPSSSSELRCQNSHKDLSDPRGMGAASSASRTVGCLRGEAGLGSHLPAGEGKPKTGANIFFGARLLHGTNGVCRPRSLGQLAQMFLAWITDLWLGISNIRARDTLMVAAL